MSRLRWHSQISPRIWGRSATTTTGASIRRCRCGRLLLSFTMTIAGVYSWWFTGVRYEWAEWYIVDVLSWLRSWIWERCWRFTIIRHCVRSLALFLLPSNTAASGRNVAALWYQLRPIDGFWACWSFHSSKLSSRSWCSIDKVALQDPGTHSLAYTSRWSRWQFPKPYEQ